MNEKDTIENILKLARRQGVEEKVKMLILRYQDAMKSQSLSKKDREDLSIMGIAEIHKTIGCVGELVVNGKLVLPSDSSYQDDIDANKRLVKLD